MMRLQLRKLPALLGLAAAIVVGSSTPMSVAAQGGPDDTTFWDDPGQNDSTADIPSPGHLSNTVYLNPNGGRTPDDGLLITIGNGKGDQIIRDRDHQIYWYSGPDNSDYPIVDFGTLGWTLVSDGACFSERNQCSINADPTLGNVVTHSDFFDSKTNTLIQDGPTVWKAKKVLVTDWNSHVYTVTVDYTYTAPDDYVYLETKVTVSPDYTGEMQLYLNTDMQLDGSDNGPGTIDFYKGRRVTMQYNATSAGGLGEGDKRPFDSYFEGFYLCLYSMWSFQICGNTDAHWNADVTSPDSWFGPGFAEGYPMPPIVGGRSSTTAEDKVDAGVGGHWDITTNRKVDVYYIFTTRENLLANLTTTPDGAIEPCDLLPDIAVDPQYIYITPGGRATITVTMRNLCNDRPLRTSDLLLSLSDGMRVVSGSAGLVNLGQRAAIQGFSLNPAETRSWTFEVEAGAMLPTAPIFVVELYQGSGVARRIDGVFITPAPVPAEPAPAAAPAEPAPAVAPAEPAPIPAALPNTGGEQLPAAPNVAHALLLTILLALGLKHLRSSQSR